MFKLLTTAALLGAIYAFVVLPIVDKGERAVDTVTPVLDRLDDVPADVETSVRHAERLSEDAGDASKDELRRANRLISCVRRAGADLGRISSCTERYAL
jgi:hypothetical protein